MNVPDDIEFTEITDRQVWMEESTKLYHDPDYRFGDGSHVSAYLICDDDSEFIMCDGGSTLRYLERALGRCLKPYLHAVSQVFEPHKLHVNDYAMVYVRVAKPVTGWVPGSVKLCLQYFTVACSTTAAHLIVCPEFRRILDAN